MKTLERFLVTAALVAAVPAAHAVSLSPNGLGQVLIYPYYTVNKDQDTLISVANASDLGKLVHVWVMEGYNGRSVLDFDLVLSPHDVWTAGITQIGDDSGALLRTSDTSCTDPVIPADGVELRAAGYDGSGGLPADAGPQGITRVREGFITIGALADIDPGSVLATATTHVQNGTPGGGVPPDCAGLQTLGLTATLAPTDALYGSGTIIDVGLGTFFAYNASALADYTDQPLNGPSATLPLPFIDANSDEATNGVARSYAWDADGKPVVADWEQGVDAVSAALIVDSIQNEYLVSPALGASTDWVITFPTKAFYVDDFYDSGVPFPPFAERFTAPGVSLVVTVANHYDREEGASVQPAPCETTGCPAVPPLMLAYEVNVMSYVPGSSSLAEPFVSGTPSRVLGSTLTYSAFDPNGTSGFSRLDLYSGDGGHSLFGGVAPDGNALAVNGLPSVGFMVYNIINTNAQPGLLANYGGLFAHKATTGCVGAAPCPFDSQ